MSNSVKNHYQNHPYPVYPLLASVLRCDTYALNIEALWARFNRVLPPPEAHKILLAGCGTFAPYPWGVANPQRPITALDLSENSLKRARWHCLLHGRRNVRFRSGDLLDEKLLLGRFGLIDSFGVLHHLDDPLAGLKALESHLVPGGILRVMLYSRYARREEESIRRAFRFLGIDSVSGARRLLTKARPGSRLASYLDSSDETNSASGLADALLHPRVHTYRIDELLAMIAQTALEPLLFAHRDALENPDEEIVRLRDLEKRRRSPGNFVLYLRKRGAAPAVESAYIYLNPCLKSVVTAFTIYPVQIPARLGVDNPPLDYAERRFLRRFTAPVLRSNLTAADIERVTVYKRLLFLLEYA